MSRTVLLFDHNQEHFQTELNDQPGEIVTALPALRAVTKKCYDWLFVAATSWFPALLKDSPKKWSVRALNGADELVQVPEFSLVSEGVGGVIACVHMPGFETSAQFKSGFANQTLHDKVALILAVTVRGVPFAEPPCLVGTNEVPVFFVRHPLKSVNDENAGAFCDAFNLAHTIVKGLKESDSAGNEFLDALVLHRDWNQDGKLDAATLLNVQVDDPCLAYVLAALVEAEKWDQADKLLMEPGLVGTRAWLSGCPMGVRAELRRRKDIIQARAGAPWPIPHGFVRHLATVAHRAEGGAGDKSQALKSWFENLSPVAVAWGLSEQEWSSLASNAVSDFKRRSGDA